MFLSLSSLIWYEPKDDDALQLGRLPYVVAMSHRRTHYRLSGLRERELIDEHSVYTREKQETLRPNGESKWVIHVCIVGLLCVCVNAGINV